MKTSMLVALAFCAPAFGQVASEDFSTGNTDQWSREGIVVATHQTTGGNPGGMIQIQLSNTQTTLFVPLLMPKAATHPWSGNFQALGVTGFRFDREVVSGSANFGTHPYLVLGNDNGTALNFLDDTMVYIATGDNFQFGAQPWATFNIPIPSQSVGLPAGWSAAAWPNSPISTGTDDDIWIATILDVSYVGISVDQPYQGIWFGQHLLNFDNFVLEGPQSSGVPFCSPMDNNSTGSPTTMTANMSAPTGSGLHLDAQGGPPSEFGYFLVGTAISDPGLVVSGGRLCLSLSSGNEFGRYNVSGTASTSIGAFDAAGILQNLVGTSSVGSGFDVPSVLPLTGTPTILSGSTWHFQLWHRDTAAGTGASNFSNGLSITF